MVIRSLFFPLLTLAAAPVAAQEAPSVESYLCTFAGKCDVVDAAPQTMDAPQTKGFRLARPVADKPAAKARANVARVATPTPSRAAPRRATRAPVVSDNSLGKIALPRAPVPGDNAQVPRPRADLMIGFDLNSSRLSADGVRSAQVFARSLLMPELKSKRFVIEGHTDISGGRRLNLALSRDRAKAVVDYLVRLGVDRSRLEARGFGPDEPLAGHTKSDPDNRRVEAELIS